MTLNEAKEILEENDYTVLDENDSLDEALEILAKTGYNIDLNEDFGIGVGGPAGLDQGIPHGGDCVGTAPRRMGCAHRPPHGLGGNPFFNGVPDAHHPQYWLNQIKVRKKKRRKKNKK